MYMDLKRFITPFLPLSPLPPASLFLHLQYLHEDC